MSGGTQATDTWIDAITTPFDRAWRAGRCPRIEDLLVGVFGRRRAVLLEELLRVELEYRRAAGESVPLEEYRIRFPEDTETIRIAFPPVDLAASADTVAIDLAEHPNYEVVRELGRGGMGIVYLARNRLMDRDEVLKVMERQIIDRPGVLDRFLREIRVVAQLRHPNIVTAYTAFQSSASLVFAMEYVEGLDLARMLKAHGAMPVEHACYYAHQAALGLQHAHERGMVHRDIKPGNLMLSRNGNQGVIKVLDFGLAKADLENRVMGLQLQPSDVGRDGAFNLTQSGQILGTPDFIAPEQIADAQRADIRADIYSLGCTLYYLLSGRPPFSGTTLDGVLEAHHSMEARPLNSVRPEVSAELTSLVAKMMAKYPDRRLQTPSEVAQALVPFFRKKVAPLAHLSSGSLHGEKPSTGVAKHSSSSPAAVATRSPQAAPATARADLLEFREIDDNWLVSTTAARPDTQWSGRLRLALIGFAAILFSAAFICRIITNTGELAIETNDPNIKLVVEQNGEQVSIIDPKTKSSIELRSGQYELNLTGGEPGLRLSTEAFALKRGDKTVVTVRRGPTSTLAKPPEASDVSRVERAGKPAIPPLQVPPPALAHEQAAQPNPVPPARDAVAGELILEETFDTPHNRLFIGETNITRSFVENGVYVTETPPGHLKLGGHHWFGPSTDDLVFSVRCRATKFSWAFIFRQRFTKASVSELRLYINPDGTWRLVRFTDSVDAVLLAGSYTPTPELAAGRWFNLFVRSVGAKTEVRVNNERLCLAEESEPVLGQLVDRGLGIGGWWETDSRARFELDYLMMWRATTVPAPDGAPSHASDHPRSLGTADAVPPTSGARPSTQPK
jgi:serine/threonine protein kinase